MIIELSKYEESLYVVKKETENGIVWICYNDTPEEIKKELKDVDAEYYRNYKIHIIEFENDEDTGI
ncbi:MAG: hypothetical protein II453_02980 [Alphaproteobacteria bacterium]|nr:hypothetical protein [Alphaproteobacteria bacterium]MBQ2395822.1 hypothetical protein [Bacteroidales bacterium]